MFLPPDASLNWSEQTRASPREKTDAGVSSRENPWDGRQRIKSLRDAFIFSLLAVAVILIFKMLY